MIPRAGGKRKPSGLKPPEEAAKPAADGKARKNQPIFAGLSGLPRQARCLNAYPTTFTVKDQVLPLPSLALIVIFAVPAAWVTSSA